MVCGYFGAQGEGNDVIVYNLPQGWKQGDPVPSEALRFTWMCCNFQGGWVVT